MALVGVVLNADEIEPGPVGDVGQGEDLVQPGRRRFREHPELHGTPVVGHGSSRSVDRTTPATPAGAAAQLVVPRCSPVAVCASTAVLGSVKPAASCGRRFCGL